jgi:hypothetical protein
MPKKIIIESFIHHLATAARKLALEASSKEVQQALFDHIASWHFEIGGSRLVQFSCTRPMHYSEALQIPSLHFYTRGDTATAPSVGTTDTLQEENQNYFKELAGELLKRAQAL